MGLIAGFGESGSVTYGPSLGVTYSMSIPAVRSLVQLAHSNERAA